MGNLCCDSREKMTLPVEAEIHQSNEDETRKPCAYETPCN